MNMDRTIAAERNQAPSRASRSPRRRDLGATLIPRALLAAAALSALGLTALSLNAANNDPRIPAPDGAPGFIGLPLPTTPEDFIMPGTQPGGLITEIVTFSSCSFCHAGFDQNNEPGRWRGSLHANSARDPVFLAAVSIANQDAPGSGETCFRCHAPAAWLGGRVIDNPNGDQPPFFQTDYSEGISCNFCHRMVDPVYEAGISPASDELILADLITAGDGVPTEFGNAQYVIDPSDVRRGPNDYDPQGNMPPHSWEFSPLHLTGDMCGTCHEVSNPLYLKTPEGNYEFAAFDAPHPTNSKHDQFPEQRTYSEWLNSAFATGGVDLEGRFGGNQEVVSSCQTCHMPRIDGYACQPFFGFGPHTDHPHHTFQGANRWIIDVLQYVYAEDLDFEVNELLEVHKSDTEYMLEQATDLDLSQDGDALTVRVTNYCGHKLLTGMPEGRRIWINVKFFDAGANLIAEAGAYDFDEAILDEESTKVYEALLGLDDYAAAVTGKPAGKSFNLMLVNTVLKDNRIPPIGFTNAGFEAAGAGFVDYSYPDGQNWDDTVYQIPPGAVSASATLYYQTASREYIEFLRDENTTDNRGDILYDAWLNTGKAAPFPMSSASLALDPIAGNPADLNNDGFVNSDDLGILLSSFGCVAPGPCTGDVDGDGDVDSDDLGLLLSAFGS
ncbi:MAG: hypothetical protein ACTS3F_03015 [Phycisphaerales bacterium]